MAKAAYCADQQDMFWEYHEELFAYEGEITKESLANLGNLNKIDFFNCIDSEEAEQEINKDFEDGKLAGVYGTPTFFINDVVVVGPKPLRYFSNIIDKELEN
jgi:protein-disulfide isomerase